MEKDQDEFDEYWEKEEDELDPEDWASRYDLDVEGQLENQYITSVDDEELDQIESEIKDSMMAKEVDLEEVESEITNITKDKNINLPQIQSTISDIIKSNDTESCPQDKEKSTILNYDLEGGFLDGLNQGMGYQIEMQDVSVKSCVLSKEQLNKRKDIDTLLLLRNARRFSAKGLHKNSYEILEKIDQNIIKNKSVYDQQFFFAKLSKSDEDYSLILKVFEREATKENLDTVFSPLFDSAFLICFEKDKEIEDVMQKFIINTWKTINLVFSKEKFKKTKYLSFKIRVATQILYSVSIHKSILSDRVNLEEIMFFLNENQESDDLSNWGKQIAKYYLLQKANKLEVDDKKSFKSIFKNLSNLLLINGNRHRKLKMQIDVFFGKPTTLIDVNSIFWAWSNSEDILSGQLDISLPRKSIFNEFRILLEELMHVACTKPFIDQLNENDKKLDGLIPNAVSDKKISIGIFYTFIREKTKKTKIPLYEEFRGYLKTNKLFDEILTDEFRNQYKELINAKLHGIHHNEDEAKEGFTKLFTIIKKNMFGELKNDSTSTNKSLVASLLRIIGQK